MGITAAILAVGAGVGLGTKAIVDANKGEKASSAGAEKQDDLSAELNARKSNEESQENQNRVRDEAAKKQKAAARAATGRNDTILTSPLGLPNQEEQNKTVLGF